MARRGGLRRLGRKRFRYEDWRGNPISDDETLERIRALAIPPAWTDVWIASNPRAKLQAIGTDVAGRRQYLYHENYRAAQEEKKFDRLIRFGELLPGLRKHMAEHLELDPFEPDWTAAVALSFVNRAWFRVGSERYAKQTRTYGVTTLRKRHASVRGDRVTFRFRAKHKFLVRTSIVDPVLSDAVRSLLAYPGGSRLFRFERDGEQALLTGAILNDYVGEHLGEEFTTKDFRTWGGTLAAALAFAEHGPPESPGDERRVLAAVMRRVGSELGNTASVARAAYVSPAVIEQWRSGRTLEGVSAARAGPALVGGTRGLLPEEKALLTLLRSWRIREGLAA